MVIAQPYLQLLGNPKLGLCCSIGPYVEAVDVPFWRKTVLTTRASYDLGEQFAHSFAGAALILAARSHDLPQTVAEQCRVKTTKSQYMQGVFRVRRTYSGSLPKALANTDK